MCFSCVIFVLYCFSLLASQLYHNGNWVVIWGVVYRYCMTNYHWLFLLALVSALLSESLDIICCHVRELPYILYGGGKKGEGKRPDRSFFLSVRGKVTRFLNSFSHFILRVKPQFWTVHVKTCFSSPSSRCIKFPLRCPQMAPFCFLS